MTKNYNLFNWIPYFRKSLMTLILIALSVFTGMSQTTGVKTGTVVDETGLPLPGVSVKIKNAAGGTMTDNDGKFSIKTDDKSALLFSYMGYDTQEIGAGAKNPIKVSLKPTDNLMNEVVVVGYVTKNKSQLVSSVSTVSAKKLLDVTSNSTSAMLQGKASGVNVSVPSGQPGASTSIRIRGTGTLSSGSEPLMVVDGVIGGTANPRDIESISILKDAAATGLYGSRAANGVIVITTKQGKAGKTKIDYSGAFGLNTASEGNFKVMNGQQLRDYSAYMYTNDYTGKRAAFIKELQKTIPNPTQQQIDDFLASKDLALTLPGYLAGFMPVEPGNTDWRDLAFRQGITNNQALSISGGDEKTKFYVGANYYDEQGTLVNTDYKSFNFRTNLEHKINDRFKVTARLNAGFTKTNNDPSGALDQSYTNMPWDNPYNADGSPKYVDANSQWYGRDKSNFLYVSQYNRDNSRGQNLSADVKLEYKVTDWLNFATSNRYTVTNSRAERLIDPRTPAGKANRGELYNGYGYTNSFITSNLFNAAHSFGKHNLSGIAGFEYQQNYVDGLNGTGTGILPDLSSMDATAIAKGLSGNRSMSRFVSELFMGDYNYDNRYFATVSMRNDGSSKFGANSRYGLFYSFGAGWNIANEKFFESKVINTLKLRGSYGVTGNTPGGDYAHLDLYLANVQYGGIPGAFPRSLPNPNLTWETPTTINAGLDISFFNRIDLSIDAYQRTNKDLILDVPLPSETGFYFSTENIGSVRNKGIDIELNTKNLTGEFKWNTSFNIGINKNKVLGLYRGQAIERGYQRVAVGRDLNSWYMEEWAGVDPKNGDPLWYMTKTDANGVASRVTTNNLDNADRQFVGTSTPDFIGGIGNEFSYKNFSLNAFFNFVSGGTVYNSARELFDADGAYPQYNSMILKSGWSRWENPGDIATHPKAVANGNRNSNKRSSRYLEDGSYIRLRNITLGYTLSDKVTEKLKLSNVRFFVSGDNLITLTKFSGMDPEVSLVSEGNNAVGVSGTKYPISKKVLFGVNVSF
ncbi:SusC/RagA family TonB-linked outer membrane protein [Pedobacter gandavensis]|uniref:SusC/RagA family TonB-linked outer membrane protein n=1 Tax=Pedobacter gandavensis TaxID=2679963 RepID=A0ABR6EXX0_9SPHI|nr:TonB-dependent receptor [Pedobacter gandavensis]MBB2150069.1 SusC/RagA family TonB-linked outer membrane protein [Pedobacter gandavensis]